MAIRNRDLIYLQAITEVYVGEEKIVYDSIDINAGYLTAFLKGKRVLHVPAKTSSFFAINGKIYVGDKDFTNESDELEEVPRKE